MKYDLIYYSIGDWGADPAQPNCAKFVANAMATYYHYLNPTPSFVISLGDNFYNNGVTGISDNLWDAVWYSIFIKPFSYLQKMRWFSILGNHDYYGGVKNAELQIEMSNYSNNWVMPAKDYYAYDKETSSYHIFIDTVKIYPELYDSTRLLYSLQDIQSSLMQLEQMLIHATKLKSRWIFVYGHYHLFSNGYYGNYKVMIERILPLLKKYNVSVYFSGHEHNFQLFKYNGIHFCVNGAGAYTSQINRFNSNPDATIIYGNINKSNNGFLIHKLNDKYLNLQFVNINNIVEFDYHIPHPGLEPGSPR